ncbi:hypothetical protein J1N35_005471 [Gossypium stocksii]|uniref:Uncharacterized protein n=1 Tax=Gossypium stocksii TaxID=47602 RepID=A0A9D3WEC8_9ROSI|nr:hypothetical protein J1N35_005471 [Gossypium stocksii]
MPSKWSSVLNNILDVGASLYVLMLLSLKNEESIHVGRDTVPRLVPSSLLRGLRLVSRIPRAQKPWLQYVHWMACEHGEYAKSCYANVNASGGGRWDETINNDDSLF